MENTVHRIKQYIDSKGMSVRKFEESVGFSNGSFASQFKNNKTIGADKVENILHIYPDINPEWLLTGKGPMLRDNLIEPDNWIEWHKPSHQSNFRLDKSGLRLSEVVKQKKIELHELKNLLKTDDSFYKMVSGEIPVSEVVLDKILELYPDISEKWLYTGHGDMFHPITESVQHSVLYQQESSVIFLLKEQIKEKEAEIKKLSQEIGRLTERLSVFMAGKEQIEDVEDVDAAAVG